MKNTELLGEYRAQYDAEIKRLEAEVEGMKCCGNCSHLGLENNHILFCDNDMYPFPITGKCDKWEERK
jgi:hypothetical protein